MSKEGDTMSDKDEEIEYYTMENYPLEVVTPFGPPFLKSTMPAGMIDEINDIIDEMVKDDEACKEADFSGDLVGMVHQQLKLSEQIIAPWADWLAHMSNQIWDCAVLRDAGNSSNPAGDFPNVLFPSHWIVRQFAGEFNPVHLHTNCSLSYVGYLKTPDWKEEKESDDRYSCKGDIEFICGNPLLLSNNRLKFSPQVGDFFMFPSWLQHVVYPFNSPGERRSIAGNGHLWWGENE